MGLPGVEIPLTPDVVDVHDASDELKDLVLVASTYYG